MELTEREKALEEKYILDFERSLRVRERRDRLLAGWAAHVLDRADAAAYAEEIAEASRIEAGDDDVLSKVLRDFERRNRCDQGTATGKDAGTVVSRRRTTGRRRQVREAVALPASYVAPPPFSADATVRFTATKLSGVTEIESMPHSTRNVAKSG